MSSAHSMNARKCVHVQKPYQAFAHESSKVGYRCKREGDTKDRGQEADGKKGSPSIPPPPPPKKKKKKKKKKKNIRGTKSRPT